MANLLYYQLERQEYKEVFEKKLDCAKGVEIVVGKLFKHFKLGTPQIGFTSGRNHSKCLGRTRLIINLDCGMNFGHICHEVAHNYQFSYCYNNDKNWHGKEHKKIMKRMVNYCKKKNWFEVELSRRLNPKPIKPKPTKEEIKAKELIKLQEKIIRYEKKVLFYQRKLSKSKRSYNARIRILNLVEVTN